MKRDRESESEDFGPIPQAEPNAEGEDEVAQPAAKKPRVKKWNANILEDLPSAELYEKSYMHRDTVTHVRSLPRPRPMSKLPLH